MDTANDNLIVKPVPNVFTFVGDDGKNLRDVVMELNSQWSFYMVKRVGDDAQLDALNETLNDVEVKGVDRASMAAVEALQIAPLSDNYPVSSYTLKRSKTQQKVACEEILKQVGRSILTAIRTAIKWVKDKVTALLKWLSSDGKKKKKEQTDSMIKKIHDVGLDFKYKSSNELRDDPDVQAHATAIGDNYTVFINRVCTDKKTVNALAALVKDPGSLLEYLDKTSELLTTSIKAIVTGKELGTINEPESYQSSALSAYLDPFSDRNDPIGKRTLEVTRHFSEENGESASINPFDFKSLTDICQYLMMNLSPEGSIYLFDDQVLNRITATAEKVNASLDATDKLLSQAHDGTREQAVVGQIRGTAEKLAEALGVLNMIAAHSENFYNVSANWLKIFYLQLVNCREEKTAK